jgi:hypothetical protein
VVVEAKHKCPNCGEIMEKNISLSESSKKNPKFVDLRKRFSGRTGWSGFPGEGAVSSTTESGTTTITSKFLKGTACATQISSTAPPMPSAPPDSELTNGSFEQIEDERDIILIAYKCPRCRYEKGFAE